MHVSNGCVRDGWRRAGDRRPPPRYAKVYYQFKPDVFWWPLVIVSRKFGIAFTALMFNNLPAFQLAVALLVMFLSYSAQVGVCAGSFDVIDHVCARGSMM